MRHRPCLAQVRFQGHHTGVAVELGPREGSLMEHKFIFSIKQRESKIRCSHLNVILSLNLTQSLFQKSQLAKINYHAQTKAIWQNQPHTHWRRIPGMVVLHELLLIVLGVLEQCVGHGGAEIHLYGFLQFG